MKSKLILIAGLLSGHILNAQITINSSDLPTGGDTVVVSSSIQFTTVDVATTGPNQTWDFTFLEADTQRIDTFFNLSSASAGYQLSFNNQFLSPDYKSDYYTKVSGNNLPAIPGGFVSIDNPVIFTKNSPTNSEQVGLGMEINGYEVPTQADTIDVVYEFPMTYNDNWTSRSYLYIDMNPAFNAIFKRHQLRNSTVDGWGTITTPFGSFDAVRVKSDIFYTDSIYVDLGFGAQWNAVPTPNETVYTWWTNNNKVPVLKITVSNGAPNSIEYRDAIDYTSVSENKALVNSLNVYPNPATNILNVETTDYIGAQIDIYSVNGQLIYTSMVNETNTALDLSKFNSGLYYIKLKTDQTVVSKAFIVE